MKLAAFQISVTEEHERKGLGGKYSWELALLLCIRSQFTKSLPRLLSELRQLHCVGVGVDVWVFVCVKGGGEKESEREKESPPCSLPPIHNPNYTGMRYYLSRQRIVSLMSLQIENRQQESYNTKSDS